MSMWQSDKTGHFIKCEDDYDITGKDVFLFICLAIVICLLVFI